MVEMCPFCETLITNKTGIHAHDHLRECESRDFITLVTRSYVSIKLFRCEKCGTQWTHQNDPNDETAGWATFDSEPTEQVSEGNRS